MSVRTLRRLVFGEAIPTSRAIHERLPKFLALPVFASDNLSSSAYATEEILLVLVLAGPAALHYSIPIALAIVSLTALVAISYRQTVMAYPTGGGSYIVARANLGVYPGLAAAAALLVDYILTVSVSVAAGIAAITSAAPALLPYSVHFSLLCIAIITFANLRGARESGALFAFPTYLFIFSMGALVVVGLSKALAGNLAPLTAPAQAVPAYHPLTLFLLLKAFSSGCAAVTGVEAISNGVQAFRPPESRNAAITLLWMAGLLSFYFMGLTVLAHIIHLVPDLTGHETVDSKLARAIFGDGFFYHVIQAATAMILILAANTSFADFPRLSAILARDGFAPRQFANVGDRLVFSVGIVALGLAASVLIILFHADTHALIPLYMIGVFLAFTLSQAGMARRFARLREKGWQARAALSSVGAVITTVVLIVAAITKFLDGGWIVIVLLPLIILAARKIHNHYQHLAAQLSLRDYVAPRAVRHCAVVLVPGLHHGIVQALLYAKALSSDCQAVYLEQNRDETARLEALWHEHGQGVPLVTLKPPSNSLARSVLTYLQALKTDTSADLVTVVLPERVPQRWWQTLVDGRSLLRLKRALRSQKGIVVTTMRYYPDS